MTTAIEPGKGGILAYLRAEVSQSPTQASLQRLYIGCVRFSQNPLAVIGLGILLVLLLVAIFAPLIAPFPMNEQNLGRRLLPPGGEHLFGTDELGRDIFSRVVYGSRITLQITCLVAVIAAPIGLLVGTVSGYFGGWTDTILMRITDLFLSFPGLILALAFVAALGPGIRNAVIAIALTVWPPIARLARAETLTVRSSDYIAAIRAQGAPAWRIVVKHIVPMCLSSVIIRITLNMAGIILTAAALGFLGLGAQPPMPEWGAMLSTGRQ